MFAIPDADTLRLCSFLNVTAFGSLFLLLWGGRQAERHFLVWAGSSFSYSLVMLGFSMLDTSRLAITTALFVLLAFSNLLVVIGTRAFHGTAPLRAWMAMPLIAAGGLHALPRLIDATGLIAISDETMGVFDIVALFTAMAISGGAMVRGRARGERIVGGAMLAYLPAFSIALWAQTSGFSAYEPLALAPMVADQMLLGVLNLGLLAIPFDRAQQQLREMALRDPLTRVWNRAGLERHQHTLARPGTSVIAIDVDHFKSVNDFHGHQAGDAVLISIAKEAERLAATHGGLAVRIGGDEFVLVLPSSCRNPGRVGEELAKALDRARDVKETMLWSLSMGVATWSHGDDLAQVLNRADQALYQAKTNGRNRLAA